MFAKVNVCTLHPNNTLCIDDNKAHLGDARHTAHRLSRFGQKIVLGGDSQGFVTQDWQSRFADLPNLRRLRRGIAVQDVDIGLCL